MSDGSNGVSGSLHFKFADVQGAIYVLRTAASREDLHPSREIARYIVQNHDSWHQLALNRGLDLDPSGIIFVKGWYKTGGWALAAATQHAQAGEMSFSAGFGAVSKAGFAVKATEDVAMSAQHRCGPATFRDEDSGQLHPSNFDQCMFLHYYRVKRRLRYVGPKYLRAAGGSKDLNDSHRDAGPSTDMGNMDLAMNTSVEYNEGDTVKLDEFPPRIQVCHEAISR